MEFKLQIVRNGEVIIEIPFSKADWPKNQLENELKNIEGDFQRFSEIFDALSNQTRLRMMRRLVKEEDLTISFADFMRDLNLNPKIVWENSRKLKDGGLLKKTGRGRYSCSEFGQRVFLTMSLALHRLIEMEET